MALDQTSLQAWLQPLDGLRLECDGMTRVIAALLTREGICHLVCRGRLEIDGEGMTPRHWWIELGDGLICDWRARMWLGDGQAVPHGVFIPGAGVRYVTDERFVLEVDHFVFEVLSGMTIEKYPKAPAGRAG